MSRPRPAAGGAGRARHLAAQALDLAVMAGLLTLGVLGFGPVFGGWDYLIAGLGGLVLGLVIAAIGARFRWGTLTVCAAAVLAYFAFGGALAARASTLFGFVPTFDTLRDLAVGVVFSWKQLLTVEAPVAGLDGLLIVPLLAALILALVAGSLALRSTRPVLALIPVLALFVLSIGFGTHETTWPVVRGILLAAGCVGWYAWRRAQAQSARLLETSVAPVDEDLEGRAQLRTRHLLLGAGVLALALLIGVPAGSAIVPASARQVLRDSIVPPLDLQAYPSPLVAFRKYVRDFTDETLLTVDGLPDGARVRLATLDRYDGIVYNVSGDGSTGSGTFSRVGSAIAQTEPGEAATIDVTIGALTGVWVPDVGALTALEFTGDRAAALSAVLHYNRTTGVAVTTLPLKEGDSYTASVVVPVTFTDEQLASRQAATLTMPVSAGVPAVVGSSVDAVLADSATVLDQVRALESTLHTDGFFSHGLEGETVSRAGHGAERIDVLLGGDQMVGDDEQYAVALALQVSQLGIPARVVMGFYPAEKGTGPIELTGSDLHAWVEVAFDGAGWVSFDPTPPEDQIPQSEQPTAKSDPQSQVLQPPLPPQIPAELPPDVLADDQADDAEGDAWSPLFLLTVTGSILGLLTILIGPGLLIGGLKVRRRRKRATSGRPIDRLSNGWNEVVDTATDLGLNLVPGATRRESSVALAEHYPASGVTALAVRIDTGVFGPVDPTDEQLSAFWTEVDRSVHSMHRSVGRTARLKARLSLRSFRAGWMKSATKYTQKRRTTR